MNNEEKKAKLRKMAEYSKSLFDDEKAFTEVLPDYYADDCNAVSEYELEEYPILDGKKHPFAIVVPGGGYENVCSYKEGVAFVRAMYKRGFSGFVLRYRTGDDGRYPNPQDDLARAVKELFDRAEELQLDTSRYFIWGSSAGGHLAASFGTENMGYMKYGLPKPSGLVLCYPVISMGPYTHEGSRDHLLGLNCSEEMIHFASVEENVTKNYPPTFAFHGEPDGCVPCQNSRMLMKRLAEEGITHIYYEYPTIGHGVGVAKGMECEKWVDNAIHFMESL